MKIPNFCQVFYEKISHILELFSKHHNNSPIINNLKYIVSCILKTNTPQAPQSTQIYPILSYTLTLNNQS